ncbi:MAG: DUF475 domain-containing protein, partial [Bacteroidota bacterium]|nr:DUF475 domain-containing protein [Bacteroidota bacterium]
VMVMDLPKHQRKKALRYGIIGAYVFRGLSLFFISLLQQIWWIKPISGIYLMYLAFKYFTAKNKSDEEMLTEESPKKIWLYRNTVGFLGPFWAVVAMVELMDLVFSVDNVFAAVTFSNNIYLIMTGVFIGILSMRLVTQFFVTLLDRFPYIEVSAYIVIGLLGIKLFLDLPCHFLAETKWCQFTETESLNTITSILTITIFALPILWDLIIKRKSKQA